MDAEASTYAGGTVVIQTMTLDRLQSLLAEHDDGVLRSGAHREGREFCALEFESKVRGRDWSDAPVTLPDMRPINDGLWSSDAARTDALLPVMVALWGWSTWTLERRIAWAQRIALETVRQIVAELPGLSDAIRTQCRDAKDLTAAEGAAERAGAWAAAAAAMTEAAAEAAAGLAVSAAAAAARAGAPAAAAARVWAPATAWAATAAARAGAAAEAEAAVGAAAEAEAAVGAEAADSVLRIACQIWIQAAEA
jgi:hypothetical protein